MPKSKIMEAKKTLSGNEFIILAFIDQGINYGLDIVDKSHGMVNRGTVYNTLQRFCKLGFLDCARKISKQIVDKSNVSKTQFVTAYELTEEGKQVLKINRRSWNLMYKILTKTSDERKQN